MTQYRLNLYMRIDPEEELDATGAIFDVGENNLPHRASGPDPSGEGHR